MDKVFLYTNNRERHGIMSVMKSGEGSNKIASYLQAHIAGDVFSSSKIRKAYATDDSILEITPSLVVYPRTTNDIRKVARFAWQLAEKGHVFPITPRGYGSDTSGAAIGKGIILNMAAHMGRILELDTKQRLVRVQPGLNFRSLQETLHTHGLFLPAYPANYKYSTIGGALANNASGEKSFKYGSMIDWVQKLEVVLANGEVIQTGKISKKELEKKKGLPTLEGEIYRAVDGLTADHEAAIYDYDDNRRRQLARDNVGYSLADVFMKDGSCDLTALFVGSQGTLGVITEAILKVELYSPQTSLVVASFSSHADLVEAADIAALAKPSSIEYIDETLIDFAKKEKGLDVMKGVFDTVDVPPKALLFVEFDDENQRKRNKKVKKLYGQLSKFASDIRATDDLEAQESLWAARSASSAVMHYEKGHTAAVPVIDDCIVPTEKFLDLIGIIHELAAKHKIQIVTWGHAGDAHIHAMPLIDLTKMSDRQKLFKLMTEYFSAVIKLGGSIAAENNDGRLRAPFAKLQLGEELVDVNTELKKAFDPYTMLNPGVKTGTTIKQVNDILRDEYSLVRHIDYVPRT